MHTRNEQLVKMANQIATFFESQSPTRPEVSAQAVAAHLKLFWAPTMRAHLVEAHDLGETAQMSPIVDTAVRVHRATLLSQRAHLPAEAAEVFPEGGGDAG
jgi:formate dehydrogenase subunit delta